MRENWTCPFCKQPSTIGDADVDHIFGENRIPNVNGYRSLRGRFTVCPNPDCKKLSLYLYLIEERVISVGSRKKKEFITNFWHLIPDSTARVYSPEIVPQAIINDYVESCKIVGLSPKASATLARRALQGMIRDFWKVSGKLNLKQEIEAIQERVDPDVWAAIDAVRDVGNIGAHMERDVSVIIDVEPGEAEKLIELIEMLIEEWYVNRAERKIRLAAIKEIAAGKKAKQVAASAAT